MDRKHKLQQLEEDAKRTKDEANVLKAQLHKEYTVALHDKIRQLVSQVQIEGVESCEILFQNMDCYKQALIEIFRRSGMHLSVYYAIRMTGPLWQARLTNGNWVVCGANKEETPSSISTLIVFSNQAPAPIKENERLFDAMRPLGAPTNGFLLNTRRDESLESFRVFYDLCPYTVIRKLLLSIRKIAYENQDYDQFREDRYDITQILEISCGAIELKKIKLEIRAVIDTAPDT
jgi:hypothetical protein